MTGQINKFDQELSGECSAAVTVPPVSTPKPKPFTSTPQNRVQISLQRLCSQNLRSDFTHISIF